MSPLPPLLLCGDCMAELARIPDESVDAVVTDPPYGLEFMGKQWDTFATGRGKKYAAGGSLDVECMKARSGKGGAGPSYVNRPAKRCAKCGKQEWSGSPCVCPKPEWRIDNSPLESFERFTEAWAAECLRILKPGGHLLAFGGSRTWHRLAAGIEDAGFEIRDSIAWLYGSGFPKSMNVSKAIDKAAGAERQVVGRGENYGASKASEGKQAFGDYAGAWDITAPATDAAREWEGWGTALKPAFEPIVVARKPLIGTVAANVLEHGTGALNIDATRIEATGRPLIAKTGVKLPGSSFAGAESRSVGVTDAGRWPANVVLDEGQAAALDAQSGTMRARGNVTPTKRSTAIWGNTGASEGPTDAGDTGGASRFFYVAKAPKGERPVVDGTAHPTVKPLALMRWLCRLVTPPGGCIVDPFAGSGTTLEAAYLEGFESIGVEMTPEYWPLVAARIERVTR